jgi:hypothetical protein
MVGSVVEMVVWRNMLMLAVTQPDKCVFFKEFKGTVGFRVFRAFRFFRKTLTRGFLALQSRG